MDWKQPYNTNLEGVRDAVGTGYVLAELQRAPDEILICTAYHCVNLAERIQVFLSDTHWDDGPVDASLLIYSASLDVAIISVPIPRPDWMVPLRSGDSDAPSMPDAEVKAAGFPLRRGFRTTVGFISGREGHPMTRLQVDVAINPGNSGGPLLLAETHEVIGTVVSGYNNADAQLINYASPLKEMQLTLIPKLPPAKGTVVSIPELSLNADIVRMSKEMSEAMNCRKGGGYVSYVFPGTRLDAAGVKQGDIVCSIDGFDVDIFSRVSCPWWKLEALPISTLLARKSDGDEIELNVFLSQERKHRRLKVSLERTRNVYRRMDPEHEPLEYSDRGGVVMQMLNVDLMQEEKKLQERYMYVFKQPRLMAHSLLMMTYIQPRSPFTTMGVLRDGDVITQVNDTRVNTLDEYKKAFDHAVESSELVVLHTYFGDIACASSNAIKDMSKNSKKPPHTRSS